MIFFDLDDTLLDHRAAERHALQRLMDARPDVFGAHAFEAVHAVYHRHNVALWTDYADRRVTKDDLRRLRFERLLGELGSSHDCAPFEAVWYAAYADGWSFPEAARAAFERVADVHPVGVITNGFREQQAAKLDRFPALRDRLAVTVISEDVGVMKPHRALFDHAADLAGAAPADLVYVGDSLRSDVEGALGAGWRAAWFRGDPALAPKSTFCFDDWDALAEWVGA